MIYPVHSNTYIYLTIKVIVPRFAKIETSDTIEIITDIDNPAADINNPGSFLHT